MIYRFILDERCLKSKVETFINPTYAVPSISFQTFFV